MPLLPCHIRPAQRTDEPALIGLIRQLGYTLSQDELSSSLTGLIGHAEHSILIAESEGQLTGFVHGQISHRLTSPPFVEICALVVDENYRRKGVATQLVNRLGEVLPTGMRLRVRHNQQREEAARFYQKMGFRLVKTQHVLDRERPD